MSKIRIFFLLLLVAAAAAGWAWWNGRLPILPRPAATGETAGPARPGGGPGGPGGPGGFRRGATGPVDGPTPVVVAPVGREDVEVTVDGIGTVQPFAAVTVRAQVEGRIVEIDFREGQDVAAGDVLARIDPASYAAVHDQAVARRDQDEAELRNARIDLDRYIRLAQNESGSRQQADTQRSVVAKLEAQIRIDQGIIDAAKIDLDNTVIRAPIAGRTGIRTVDVGTLVRSSDTGGIVSIARLKPISVTFTLPQQQLGALQAALARRPVPVEVLGDRRRPIDRGRVEVVDNQVDSTTGTVKIKATLPNPDLALWPGQFVDVRVRLDTLVGATVVPTAAVQRGTEGAYLWVLGAENKVARRPVTVSRQDEHRAVIAEGVAVGETVLTTGFVRLVDGAEVAPTPVDGGAAPKAEADAPAEAAAETRGPGSGEGRRTRREGATGGPRPGVAP